MPSLIQFGPKGLYCEKGGFYIDPWQPVNKALITHAHSDHARPGHKNYLCQSDSVALLKHRLSSNIKVQGQCFGKRININGVDVSFHPAGHIIGSAQIRVSDSQEVWVISGDYKLEQDKHIEPFEFMKCDYFVTESTFGLPVFHWKDQEETLQEINSWWHNNSSIKRPSIISAYSLGKAQRVIENVEQSIGPILTHGSVDAINKVLVASGIKLRKTKKLVEATEDEISRALIVCPPGAMDSSWTARIKNHAVAFASGWMNLRGARRRRGVEKGFVLSDHADWPGLNKAIRYTQASKVFVTHGYTDVFTKWLNSQGINAETVKTQYTGEIVDNENEDQ